MPKMNFVRFLFFLREILRESLRILLNLCFGGGKCIVCGKKTVFGDVCRDCRKNHFYDKAEFDTGEERCSVCGKILLSENGTCMGCRKERVINSCDSVFPLLSYRLWAKNFMFQWKVMERRGISAIIARTLNLFIASRLDKKQFVIVPVPPRPGKIRRKGWDQIEETCSFLKYRYGYDVEHLLKRKGRIQQKKLDREHRLHSDEKRYVLSRKVLEKKRENLPECVILIDDVMTTGITVESCAAELKTAGIGKVFVLTVFIVD